MTGHVVSQWIGETFSVIHRNKCYTFKRRGVRWALDVVDRLDTDTSVPGEAITPPTPVRRELKANNLQVIEV